MTGKIDRNKLEGQTFGYWFVEEYRGHGKYGCRCKCGAGKTIEAHKLKGGYTTSCGCKPRKMPALQEKPKHQRREKYDLD